MELLQLSHHQDPGSMMAMKLQNQTNPISCALVWGLICHSGLGIPEGAGRRGHEGKEKERPMGRESNEQRNCMTEYKSAGKMERVNESEQEPRARRGMSQECWRPERGVNMTPEPAAGEHTHTHLKNI